MASPPRVHSPSAMSPLYGSPAPNPPKKRSSAHDMTAPPTKRRKGSIISQASGASSHPLRQTSFPPESGASPYQHARSPSVDAASHVSGSVASGTAGSGQGQGQRRRRGGRAKLSRGGSGAGENDVGGEKTPSLVGGKAPTTASGQSAGGGGGGGAGAGAGDKDALDEEEDDEKAEMALEDVVARTQEQKQEEIRLRAMLVEAFDGDQYNRYELWRAAKLSDAVVKRVVNATVSQSVPQMVATAVKAVAKLFAGEIIEAARNVQDEWILAGEKQSDLPSPPASTTSNHGNTENTGNTENSENSVNIDIEAREQQQQGQNGEGDAKEEGPAGGEARETKSDGDVKLDEENKEGKERKKRKQKRKQKQKQKQQKQEEGADLRRGPLRPDHLREAWRRYKMCGESQGVGVQQLWQTQQGTGVGRFSARTRTRLFR